jgi:hypothetical protein
MRAKDIPEDQAYALMRQVAMNDNKKIAEVARSIITAAMTRRLRIGYVPLTDAALLHVAKAQQLAAKRGLDVELVVESSCANIRDKPVAGHFDAAHLLAPAAIAVSLGIGQFKASLVAPVALGLNGNAISVSRPLFETLLGEAQGDVADPRVTAQALNRSKAPRGGTSPIDIRACVSLLHSSLPIAAMDAGWPNRARRGRQARRRAAAVHGRHPS